MATRDGNPCSGPKVRNWYPSYCARPSEVHNHIIPAGPGTMHATALRGRPSAMDSTRTGNCRAEAHTATSMAASHAQYRADFIRGNYDNNNDRGAGLQTCGGRPRPPGRRTVEPAEAGVDTRRESAILPPLTRIAAPPPDPAAPLWWPATFRRTGP